MLFGLSMTVLFVGFAIFMSFQIARNVITFTGELSQEIVAMRADRIGGTIDEQMANLKEEADGFLNGMMVDMSTLGKASAELYEDLLKDTMEKKGRQLPRYWSTQVFANTLGVGFTIQKTMEDVTQEPYYQAIMVNGAESYVGSAGRIPEAEEPVFVIAHEVRNSSGERVGVMAATVDLAILGNIATTAQVNSEGFGWIVDETGQVITHPEPGYAFVTNLWNEAAAGNDGYAEIAESMAQGKAGYQLVRTADDSIGVEIFTPIPSTEGWYLVVTLPYSVMSERSEGVIRLIVFSGIVIVLAALAVSFYLSGSVSRPIKELATYLDKVANGDFTQQLKWKRKDEIGQIAGSFNRMSDNLRHMLRQVGNITQRVAAASQQLSAVSEENSASIEEVAASMGEFAATVESVNDNVQKMVGKATSVQELSNQGRLQMQDSTRTMNGIADTATESTTVMSGVQKAAAQIAKTVRLISEIAEQTNLLALNAAIEAANAGEHGRGFAVVSDEVRNLSLETKKSAEDINSVVEQLTEQVQHAVQVIMANNEQVSQGINILEKTEDNFLHITDDVGETVRMINEIASAAETLELGSREIAASSQEQSAAMEEIASSASTLAEMVKDLETMMSQFKISDEAAETEESATA
ncbi:MAG: methyl-accepting chemotaxis protein [Firmicutes bacterium]|nr:methyl-accepting chemotaxis protein [Bacillota bacterium]